jgi:hypothetical protein
MKSKDRLAVERSGLESWVSLQQYLNVLVLKKIETYPFWYVGGLY